MRLVMIYNFGWRTKAELKLGDGNEDIRIILIEILGR